MNETVNLLVTVLDRNWQVKLKSRLGLQIHLLLHETYQLRSFLISFRQVQLLKAIRNIQTPDSIFVVTNVPFVLFAIGVD